jgi:hypothetical protein
MFLFPNVQANTTWTHHSYIQVVVSHTQDHIFENLNFCYSSQNIIQVMKSITVIWAGHAARMVERRGTCRVLVGKPEGKGLLGIPRHRCKDTVKIKLQELG